MEVEVLPALAAGLLATIVMSALMAASWAMKLTEMPAMPLFRIKRDLICWTLFRCQVWRSQ